MQGGTARMPASREGDGCKLVEGKVLARNKNTLTIRDRSKSEVTLTMTQETIVGRENPKYGGFLEGDRIEAYVRRWAGAFDYDAPAGHGATGA